MREDGTERRRHARACVAGAAMLAWLCAGGAGAWLPAAGARAGTGAVPAGGAAAQSGGTVADGVFTADQAVLTGACRGVDLPPGNVERAVAEMRAAGVRIT